MKRRCFPEKSMRILWEFMIICKKVGDLHFEIDMILLSLKTKRDVMVVFGHPHRSCSSKELKNNWVRM